MENPLFTHLEPTASTTSELATVCNNAVRKTFQKQASRYLCRYRIVIRKNFIQQTGARTFEAAAFLRRAGADIGRAKQLFIETDSSNCVLNGI